MMSCKKHLNLKSDGILFLLGAIIFFSCTEKPKKENFIARVNDSYLTREEFASLVDTTNLSRSEKEQIISDWIYRELLYQKAKEQGITDGEIYRKLINTSGKELAAALLLNDYAKGEEIEINDDELKDYYEKNKNYFKLKIDSYLINKISFSNEDKTIKFRTLAIESDWEKAVNLFSSDSNLVYSKKSEFIEENNLYPRDLARIVGDLYPQEISLVISENAEYYSVIQLLKKFNKDSTPPLEVIKKSVTDRILAEKHRQLIKDYIKNLYSNNEIEIKR